MTLDEFRNSLSERDLKGLDSEFTYSTRKLVTLFNADGAHLNRWWVLTPNVVPLIRPLNSVL